jgi:DNA-binding LacI/PurR family transcriptional regulator
MGRGKARNRANRPPDIHAVARHAGVSHQTVSRVLNEHPNVRASTRARVREAMAVLGYTPNVVARALITGRSRTLGLIVLNEELHGPASALRAIEQDARAAGYGLRIIHLSAVARSTLPDVVDSLQRQLVEAVLIIDPHPEDQVLLAPVPSGLALVTVGGLHSEGVPGVSYDSGPGVAQALEYLLGLGHETVHHVAGPGGWSESDVRREAWRDTLQRVGRPVPEPVEGDWTARSGYRAGRVLRERPGLTAVFAGNDQMALGLLYAFAEAGIPVPAQVSVIGFDDVPDAAYYQPSLTTLRQDFGELGRHAVELALRQIAAGTRQGIGGFTLPPPSLILRASAAPPPR